MPNDDLISRKALLEALSEKLMVDVFPNWKDFDFDLQHNLYKLGEAFEREIEAAPAVDAEPVRRARLLSTGYDEAWCEWGDCTNCGMSNIIGSKRCCECGAYLEEER